MVLIGHYSARDYLEYFMQEELSTSKKIGYIGKGRAGHINLKRKSYRLLP
jgi:hypothetical protein|tara:strand:- start:1462 stop:1611 length:150 start_codon:yes stop_codon:yes gene_type:complete